MDIALVSDENYFPGLWVTILSLLAKSEDAGSINLYVVDSGITDESWLRLSEAVSQHPKPPQLIRTIFSREKLDDYKFPGTRGPLPYARLFLPELLQSDKVLYLDADLLVCRDVIELDTLELNGYACASVLNEDGATIDFDFSNEKCRELNIDPKSNYFNTGLLFMNLDYWRAHDMTRKCLDFLGKHECKLVDQSAINAVMNNAILPIDRSWNRLSNFLTPAELASANCIVHYTSRNPWMYQGDVLSMLLWKKFANDTGLSFQPPKMKVSIFERNVFLGVMRTLGYGLMAIWYSIRHKRRKASGYAYAFTYWVKDSSMRKARARDIRMAKHKMLSINQAPSWLKESSSCTSGLDVGLLTPGDLPTKGDKLTQLLENRGRTRKFFSARIERRLQSRLSDLIKGKGRLHVSDLKSDVVVSLTSWPPRAKTLPLVLLTILEQTLRPAMIYVWLSHDDQDMISNEHREFFTKHGVEFKAVDDLIAHKKWLPLLELGQTDSFVIADDDTYYPKDWFDYLVSEAAQYPDCIVAHRCHKIKVNHDNIPEAYVDWEKGVNGSSGNSHLVFPTGCGGVVIHPKAISEEFRRRDLIEKLCPLADDIWLKAAYLQSGFKCRKSHYSFPCLDYPGTRESGLAVKNVDQGANDQQLKDVFDYFNLKLD
jgi:lipopolysaccharide biosynthesis glycosyltransferase